MLAVSTCCKQKVVYTGCERRKGERKKKTCFRDSQEVLLDTPSLWLLENLCRKKKDMGIVQRETEQNSSQESISYHVWLYCSRFIGGSHCKLTSLFITMKKKRIKWGTSRWYCRSWLILWESWILVKACQGNSCYILLEITKVSLILG